MSYPLAGKAALAQPLRQFREAGPDPTLVSSAAISIFSLIEDLVVSAGSTTSRYEHERKTHDLGFPHSTHWRQGFPYIPHGGADTGF